MASDQLGASRLYALVAGGFLSLLGVLGFFYDASFAVGSSLSSDDLAGILLVNGWRNVIYLITGLLALTFAAGRPRTTALSLGGFYLIYGIWGLVETERGLGSILDVLPLADRDNALHLVVGGLGLLAFAADGGLRKPAASLSKPAKERPKKAAAKARGERAGQRRSTARPRSGADA